MIKKIKVGIIGLGVGYKHFETFKQHPCCEVIGISELSKKKIIKIKKKYPNIKFYKEANYPFTIEKVDY